MGNLKLTSSSLRMPANVTALPLGADVKLRARLNPAGAAADPHLPRADQIALADIAQRFAPGSPAAAAAEEQRRECQTEPPRVQPRQVQAATAGALPGLMAPRGLRSLIALLIAVALLPSAVFGAMMWRGALHLDWPATSHATQATNWPASAPASVAGGLAVGKQAQPGPAPEAKPEPPAGSETAAISAQAAERALPSEAPQSTPVKTLNLGAAPEEKPDNEVAASSPLQQVEAMHEPESTGSIAPANEMQFATLPYDANLIGVVSWENSKPALLGATGVEEVFTAPDETAPPPEHLMRAPETDDEGKTWITAPQYVNLRSGPTSSAGVISVVAKGAKLEVLGRKRGWVKVANPETAQSGWIYTGSKARRAPRRDNNEETADGGSFWGRLFGSSE